MCVCIDFTISPPMPPPQGGEDRHTIIVALTLYDNNIAHITHYAHMR